MVYKFALSCTEEKGSEREEYRLIGVITKGREEKDKEEEIRERRQSKEKGRKGESNEEGESKENRRRTREVKRKRRVILMGRKKCKKKKGKEGKLKHTFPQISFHDKSPSLKLRKSRKQREKRGI